MPTVPKFQNDIQLTGLPSARMDPTVSKEAFGSGTAYKAFAEAASSLSDTAYKYAEKEQKEKAAADKVVADDAIDELVRRKNANAWDQKNGAFNKKGEDAIGVIDTHLPQFDKDVEDIEKNYLTSPEQKAYFRQKARDHRNEFEVQLNKHVANESFKLDEEKTFSGIANLQDDARLNWQEPNKVNRNINDMRGRLVDYAQRNGKTKEWAIEQDNKLVSSTHAGVIEQMIDGGNDLHAQSYFNGVKNQIKDAETYDKVSKLVEEGSIRGNSQRYSDRIFSAYSNDMESALAEARKIKDPKIQDATIDRIKDRFVLKDKAEKQAVEQLHMSATDIIDKTGSVDNIPAKDWAKFSLSERSALKNYAKQRTETSGIQTQWDEYYYLNTLASSTNKDEREQFLNTNLYKEYRGKLSDTEFKEMVHKQDAVKKGDTKVLKDLDGYRSNTMIVNDTLKAIGIDPNPKKGSKDATRAATFRKMVDDEIIATQEKTGKKATNEEVQGIVDRLTTNVVTERGWLFDTKKRLFEVQPNETAQIDVKDIPKEEIAKMEEVLKRKNIPMTNEILIQMYSKRVLK